MRILYAVDGIGGGGAERRLIQLLKRLDRERFLPLLVLLTDIVRYDELTSLGVKVVKIQRRIKKDPLIFARLFSFCRDFKPDVIHAWGSMSAVYAVPAARTLGIKLINAMIADAPAGLNRKQRLRSRLTFPFSDIIQSNSYAGIEAYGVPPEKRSIIHNGFDFDRMKGLKEPGMVRDELGILTPYIVGMVAGFKHQKDWDSMVRGALTLFEKRKDITLVCVGDGPDLERIRALARENGRIIFAGRRSDAESIINVFDVGVLLTDLERHGEGISNSIMEYMAAGKPVIATDGGATRELVADGETGFLIPQKSPGRLAELVDTLLNRRELREEMGRKGRDKIRREFSIDRMVREHMELYERLAAEAGRPG